MKKIWYSQPLYDIWTQYHIQSRMTPGINIEQFCQFECKEIYENDSQELWDKKTTILNMLLADHEQNLTHIFLEDPEL